MAMQNTVLDSFTWPIGQSEQLFEPKSMPVYQVPGAGIGISRRIEPNVMRIGSVSIDYAS
jgi:hypothetical protein